MGWRDRRTQSRLTLSPTQFETWELCKRKWWLERVRGLRLPTKDFFVFGTVMHSVCERYLHADELGRGEDLYPEGWHQCGDGEVSPEEQVLIQRLVEKAIEAGMLDRENDRSIEHEFRRPLLKENGVTIDVMGVIDVLYPDGIHDHKTTKNVRYAKSPEKLRQSTQMLMYARELLMQAKEQGRPPPAEITLRHNVFVKDPDRPLVRKVETTVTPAEIQEKWEEIEHHARGMVRLRATAETWSDCPDPPNMSKACNAYGGCPYQRICAGVENEETFEYRLDQARRESYSQASVTSVTLTAQGETLMASDQFMARLAERKAVAAAAAAAPGQVVPPEIPPAPPAPKPPPAAAPAPNPPAPPLEIPPWANPECKACLGTGFSSRGTPCRICDGTCFKRGSPTSAEFEISVQDEQYVWIPRKGGPEGRAPAKAAATPVQAQVREAPPPAPAPVVEAPVVEAPVAEPAPAPNPKPAWPGGPPDPLEAILDKVKVREDAHRAPGFVLCINCVPIRGAEPDRLHYLHSWLHWCESEMERANGRNFYDLDAFQRRDALYKLAKDIAPQLSGAYLVALGIGQGQSDLRALFDGLRPFAEMEISAEA